MGRSTSDFKSGRHFRPDWLYPVYTSDILLFYCCTDVPELLLQYSPEVVTRYTGKRLKACRWLWSLGQIFQLKLNAGHDSKY